MPSLGLCICLQIFIYLFFCYFLVCPCVPESVLHSLSLIGLTLQMRHLSHVCREVWFEWNLNLYKFSGIFNQSYQLSAVIHNLKGGWPWRGGIRTADCRYSENPLLCNPTYEIMCWQLQSEHKPGTLISCSGRANYFSRLWSIVFLTLGNACRNSIWITITSLIIITIE